MAQSKKYPRSDVTTAALHWLLVAAIAISLLTGLRIAADESDAAWTRLLAPILPQGSVVSWHAASAALLTFVCVGYVAFLIKARLTGRVKLDAARLRSLVRSDRRTHWQAINVAVYWAAFAMIGTMAVTGALLYAERGPVSSGPLLTAHRICAWLFIVYVVLHVGAQLALGGMRQIAKLFTPRLAYASAAVMALIVGGTATAMVYAVDSAAIRKLTVARIAPDQAPVLDGRGDDEVWARATPVTVRTIRGSNLPNGEVPVSIRALHDGTTAYFLFRWPDRTRSQKHLPLIKEADGWRVLQNAYDRQDEVDYYEDKFGVMLARSGRLAGDASVHLGPRPLAGYPGPTNGRGLHYTNDGGIVDVWHWKSVRTGSFDMIDDNYFGPPIAATPAQLSGDARYTGGYTQDPKSGGGFAMNWETLDGGRIRPLYLPADPETLSVMEPIDLDPEASDAGRWWLSVDEVEPYSPDRDAALPVGTILPSIVVEGPFEGDRGDVHAAAWWKDGAWHLEVRRLLDTGSRFDLPIKTGTHLWVAVFNHAQTRHSQHLHPVRLELQD